MNSPDKTPFRYGGQAVLEGVMMRGRRVMATSVRKPDGTIVTDVRPLGGIYQSRIARIPILRGVLLLVDTLGLGMESMEFSASVQGEKPLTRGEWAGSLLAALAIVIGVFLLAPIAVSGWMESALHSPAVLANGVEGILRLVLLILYLVLIGRVPDIRRLFAYHGAEHKTVHAFEAGVELTPENVERFAKEHPRCGTSFLVTVAVLGVFLFALLGPLPTVWKIVSRIVGIPLLVALGYEYLRLTAAVRNPALARVLAAPGVWTQALTTREPDAGMIEVAVTALQSVRRAEEPPEEKPAEAEEEKPAE